MALRLLLLFPKVIILCKCAELEGGSFVTMDMASDSLTKSFSHIACITVETYFPPCPNRMHTCAALAPHLRRTSPNLLQECGRIFVTSGRKNAAEFKGGSFSNG